MKYLAVLGRQTKLSLAELEAVYGKVELLADKLAWFESTEAAALERLGGTMKIARPLEQRPLEYLLALPAGKLVLGISDYTEQADQRQVQAEALKLKKILTRKGRSVRVVPNRTAILSTATAHHNGLGLRERHIELIKYHDDYYLSCGVQNITAYARRDQVRPARDAKVGMLPPKLAQILLNLAGNLPSGARVLDPFCGTGVVLQEAWLLGYQPCGTDIDERMVKYSKKNLVWLTQAEQEVTVGDATKHKWKQPIDTVVCECYLGAPLSKPPSEIKLKTEQQQCRGIILAFLRNLAAQLTSGVSVVLAVPAWLRPDSSYARLGLLDEVEDLGYNVRRFKCASQADLLYFREGQVVAREIIVLRKK